jgi:uncharacterized protein (UPF0333 family)
LAWFVVLIAIAATVFFLIERAEKKSAATAA